MYGVREDEEKSEGEMVHHINKEFSANGKYQQGDSPIMLNIAILDGIFMIFHLYSYSI